MENNNNLNKEGVDIIKEFFYYLFYWPIFITSLVLCVLIAFFYLRYTPPVYQATATLQVKEASSDPTSFLTKSADDLFKFEQVNVENDIAVITSNKILGKVVDSLNLRTRVERKGVVRDELIYGDSIPFVFEFTDDFPHTEIIVEKIDNSYNLKTIDSTYTIKNNKLLYSNFFIFKPLDRLFENENQFIINRISRTKAIDNLSKNLTVKPSSKKGDNITLEINGTKKVRNESVLNSIIDFTSNDNIIDKQEIFKLSIDFINQRLNTITGLIDTLNYKTTDFKSENLIFTPQIQTDNALSSIIKIEDEALRLSIQLDLTFSLKKNLESQTQYSLLPSNIGIENSNINILVSSYNELVLKRNNYLSSATVINPVVIQVSNQLQDLKSNIIKTIDNYRNNLQTSINKFSDFKDNTLSKVVSIPEMETKLRSFARNYQIAESLYLFLLERKEEASISYISALPNLKIVDYAYSINEQISPNNKIIYAISVVFGVGIPFIVLFLIKFFDSKIHTRNDLEKYLPETSILGEIPFVEDAESVTDLRSIVAEASRIIRSNISFLLNKASNSGIVIATSSSIKGEGKTFVNYNLALSYATTEHKVIIIGCDLRNPQIHKLTGDQKSEKGLSSYLISENKDISEYIRTLKINDSTNLDLILSGPIPPNPSELLVSKKFDEMISILRKKYDYIIIDTAPLMLVSDTLNLVQKVDLLVYVLRAHFTNVDIIPFIKKISSENLCKTGVVLNGLKVSSLNSYKYGYRYGYKYGYSYNYQYKYNYGYGYGYGSENDD